MIGYVLGALDLNALGEHIKNRSFGEEGYALVIDQEKNVIVSPFVDTRKELVNLAHSDIVQKSEKTHKGQGSGFIKLEDSPGKVFATFEKINALDWTVWINKPTEAITNAYKNAVILIIVFFLITAIMLVLVSFFLTNRLEKTIRHLLSYIKDYTKDFKEKRSLTKKIQGPQEMKELFFHFNQMIDEVEKNRNGLMKLNRELEERVQERTAILQNKNLELKAVNKLITSVSTDKDLAHFIQHCLKEIKPFMDYSIHVFFQDLAVTNERIYSEAKLIELP